MVQIISHDFFTLASHLHDNVHFKISIDRYIYNIIVNFVFKKYYQRTDTDI